MDESFLDIGVSDRDTKVEDFFTLYGAASDQFSVTELSEAIYIAENLMAPLISVVDGVKQVSFHKRQKEIIDTWMRLCKHRDRIFESQIPVLQREAVSLYPSAMRLFNEVINPVFLTAHRDCPERVMVVWDAFVSALEEAHSKSLIIFPQEIRDPDSLSDLADTKSIAVFQFVAGVNLRIRRYYQMFDRESPQCGNLDPLVPLETL